MRSRRRKARIVRIIAIIALLALCVAAVFYITVLVNKRAESQGSADIETDLDAEGSEEGGDGGSEGRTAPERVYSNKGTSDEERFSEAAYDSAIEAGSGYIVLPFVVSADGTLYVTDDDYVLDMTGVSGFLSGMKDVQVEKLQTKEGNSLLKLSDVFDKYGDSVNYIIEVRYVSRRNLEAFADIVRKYELEDKVIVSSLYYDGLSRLDKEFPDMPKVFLCQDKEGFITSLNLSYVDTISVEKTLMTEENCKAVHDKGKLFGAWTLNSEDEIRSAIEMGADSYFTDETALAVEIERED